MSINTINVECRVHIQIGKTLFFSMLIINSFTRKQILIYILEHKLSFRKSLRINIEIFHVLILGKFADGLKIETNNCKGDVNAYQCLVENIIRHRKAQKKSFKYFIK